VLLYRAGIEFEEAAPEALTKMIAEVLEATGEESRSEPAPKTAGGKAGAVKANAEERPRAPRSEGPVKIRINSEHVRRVLRRPKDEDKS
jgi:hypothetical protein